MADIDVDALLGHLEAALNAPDEAAALGHLEAARAALGAASVSLSAALGRGEAASTVSAAVPMSALRGPGVGIDPQTEDRLLIERILTLPNLSAELRRELDGYRDDIDAGILSSSDRRYLIALRQRLARAAAPPER